MWQYTRKTGGRFCENLSQIFFAQKWRNSVIIYTNKVDILIITRFLSQTNIPQVDEKTNELYARIFDIGAKKEEANIEGEGTESLPIRQNVQKEKQSEIRFPKSKGKYCFFFWKWDIPLISKFCLKIVGLMFYAILCKTLTNEQGSRMQIPYRWKYSVEILLRGKKLSYFMPTFLPVMYLGWNKLTSLSRNYNFFAL